MLDTKLQSKWHKFPQNSVYEKVSIKTQRTQPDRYKAFRALKMSVLANFIARQIVLLNAFCTTLIADLVITTSDTFYKVIKWPFSSIGLDIYPSSVAKMNNNGLFGSLSTSMEHGDFDMSTMILWNSMVKKTDNKDFRILSLDGGGSKGVYSLGFHLLKNFMNVLTSYMAQCRGSIIAALIALGEFFG